MESGEQPRKWRVEVKPGFAVANGWAIARVAGLLLLVVGSFKAR
jgi:hypothetical protein